MFEVLRRVRRHAILLFLCSKFQGSRKVESTLPAAGRCTAREEICSSGPDEPLELIEDVRIPPAFGHFFFHRLQRIGNRKGLLIGSVGSKCVVNIDNLQHRAVTGIASPLSPSGYPEPSIFSW